MNLREDAEQIVRESVARVLPDAAVAEVLKEKSFDENGKLYVVAVGKAAWRMVKTASGVLQDRITRGIVITKYDHVEGVIRDIACYEAGHPVPDENSYRATEKAIELAESAGEGDTVLFLLSGGGSALFEKPLVAPEELKDITEQLLACGADIVEMNTIRKRLSAVKGGRFAQICSPARVYSIVLSDILGDPLDMIASGPVSPDTSTYAQALQIAQKYRLRMSENAYRLLQCETPKELKQVETVVTGSVRTLCGAAKDACERLGYETIILTDRLNCEAREAGRFLAAIAKSHQESERSLAFIAGGETVVHLRGKGLGGRNQELVLAAAEEIAGLSETAIFSVGSDGTDGPTDAAGGFCDGRTRDVLAQSGICIGDMLRENDSYHALKMCGGLIKTGPTGTNVNDVSVVLIRRQHPSL